MRPRPARWFEVLVAREDATLLLESLAATGAVELEASETASMPVELRDLQPALAEFAALESRFGTWWPRARDQVSRFPEPPPATVARALAVLRDWARESEPRIVALQALDTGREATAAWLEALEALRVGGAPLVPAALADCGPGLSAALVELPTARDLDPGALALCCRLPDRAGQRVALLLASADAAVVLRAEVLAAHGHWWPAPPWLGADIGISLAAGQAAQSRDAAAKAAHLVALAALAERHALANVLSDLARLRWLLGAVRGIGTDGLFARVTGWTSDLGGRSLMTALDASCARALLQFPAPPRGASPPLLLANPTWARPFELFARAFGVPGRDEADPTPVLAVVVPLLFGYMFGDIGQGAVLWSAGAWLRGRHPLARLLMWGGLASMAFGAAFGSVFALEGVLPALWLHPLSAPLTVLVVPVAAGALLLGLGLALAALGAWWRGALGVWLARDAGTALCWLGMLGEVLDTRVFGLAVVGLLWTMLGHGLQARRVGAALAGAGECLERTLQLCVNTLSFARVGAFALAHAGLGSAVSALADAAEHPLATVLVVVIGNLAILLLEALVVSIQTTRLVLFEFFTRFLSTPGRGFVPLPPPPSRPQEA